MQQDYLCATDPLASTWKYTPHNHMHLKTQIKWVLLFIHFYITSKIFLRVYTWRKFKHLLNYFLLYFCAMEILVVPQNTHRSQSDATNNRVFTSVKLASTPPQCTPITQNSFGHGRENPQMSIRARLYSKQQAEST